MSMRGSPALALCGAELITGAAGLTFSACTADEVAKPPAAATSKESKEKPTVKERPKTKIVSLEERDALLKRAVVWQSPDNVSAVSFAPDPSTPRELDCKFIVTELGGTTSKFDCVLPSGEQIRVKYGNGPELPAEVAATRLLRGVGFGADTVNFVETLRCYGCPKEPFAMMKAVELTRAEQLYKGLMLNYGTYETFKWVTVERKYGGRTMASEKLEGWNFFELEKIDERAGGAPRAHVDALRLMGVFLAHWDNKPENQRLVCLSQEDWGPGETCRRPFALLQDVGATFGPHKVDLPNWHETVIWEDRAACRTSMRKLPYDGATFKPAQISDAGRKHLAQLLSALTDQQIRDLFTTARFDEARGFFRRSYSIDDWVAAFKAKVSQIADGPACPSVS
jgi:hypothetical protein